MFEDTRCRKNGYKYTDGTIVYLDDNSEFHREDGPAVIFTSGWKLWYLHGKQYTEEELIMKVFFTKND